MIDVLDRNVPVSTTFESDIFHKLCKDWADLSPSVNAEPSITVHDLMEREGKQRAVQAYQTGRHHTQTGPRPVLVGYSVVPTFTPKPPRVADTQEIPLVKSDTWVTTATVEETDARVTQMIRAYEEATAEIKAKPKKRKSRRLANMFRRVVEIWNELK